MAKQQDFIILKSVKMISKLDKYCVSLFGVNLENKLLQNHRQFIDKCWEQIKEAEKITGKDYLKIEE